ncbi:MAG TPA: TetR/AcrR family transcriptional regulator [Acidimicrobiales bacterium]|jgi:AcrR family transcriptional regulator|nr:TetR/AcrR family transcriptional regulator [Acidimicrobiales bacterium]
MTSKGDVVDDADVGTGAVMDPGVDSEPAVAARRPMRADAVKNQKRILEAAEEVFAVHGVSAPIDMVAERAGVGVGTLYRHFPTKEALFEAIVLSRLEELAAAASASASRDTDDPAGSLFSFLRLFAGQVANKHDLIDGLGAAGIDIKSSCSGMIDELESGVQCMLERAESVGAVRSGITNREVIGLVVGICQATEHSELDVASRERMVDVVCDGLRPRGVAPRRTPAG